MGTLTSKAPVTISPPVSPSSKTSNNEPTFEQNKNVVIETKTLRTANEKVLNAYDDSHVYMIFWDPYLSNGYINIPYSKIYDLLGSSNSQVEKLSKFRAIDAFLMNDTDFDNFEKNDLAAFLPISVGKYLVLDRFEVPYSLVSAQRVTQDAKFVNIFTDNFPRFLISLKAVIFGSVAAKTKRFFDIVMKHLANNNPGRLIMYDAFDNVQVRASDIYTYIIFNTVTTYRLLPLNITYSRSASDNNILDIEISGIVLDQYNGYVEKKR